MAPNDFLRIEMVLEMISNKSNIIMICKIVDIRGLVHNSIWVLGLRSEGQRCFEFGHFLRANNKCPQETKSNNANNQH